MLKLLAVGLGGFLGAVARYALSGFVHRVAGTSLPVGTLVVNVVGCLVVGALMCWIEERNLFTSNTRLFLLIGVLGSFTTFSTVGYETFEFFREGQLLMALANAATNALLGVTAVVIGWAGVKTLAG